MYRGDFHIHSTLHRKKRASADIYSKIIEAHHQFGIPPSSKVLTRFDEG